MQHYGTYALRDISEQVSKLTKCNYPALKNIIIDVLYFTWLTTKGKNHVTEITSHSSSALRFHLPDVWLWNLSLIVLSWK